MAVNEHIGVFEKLARQLVEGAFELPLGERKLIRRIARSIANDVERGSLTSNHSNTYTIDLNPDTLNDLLISSPQIQTYLDDFLKDLYREYGLVLSGEPMISLKPNTEMSRDQIMVRIEPGSSTRELTVKGIRASDEQTLAAINILDAFLIIDGKRHIKLRQPIITIGRHLESDIILDDTAVSRQHAQLRWQLGHFIVYDLGSKGGTLVNNQSIHRQILKNGDVLRIGHTTFIYGQESPPGTDSSKNPANDDGSTRQLPSRKLE